MPQGVCGRHAGHHPGPGGGPDGGGPGGMAPLTLGGVAIPLPREFKQLGVGQRLAAEKGTGLHLRGCLDKGLAITRRVECVPTFSMREAVLGALANSVALHGVDSVALYGVELADVEGCTLSAADTAAAMAIWGPMRCSRASWPGASMCRPCGTCSTSACSSLPAKHARRAPRRPWCRGCSSVGTRRPPRGPSVGPCRPPAKWVGSDAKAGGTGSCRDSRPPCTWSTRTTATFATACARASAIGRSGSWSGDGRAPLGGWTELCTGRRAGKAWR